MAAVVLRMYSDVVCPFCFIAERGPLAMLLERYDVTLEWRGMELHPEVPPSGIPIERLLGEGRVDRMWARVEALADDFGVAPMVRPTTLINSRRALVVAEHARDVGRLDAWRRVAMDAAWRTPGGDLQSLDGLAALGETAGLEPARVREALASQALMDRVVETRMEAMMAGVRGVPTVLFGDAGAGAPRVVGCQPLDVWTEAAERAGAARRAPHEDAP